MKLAEFLHHGKQLRRQGRTLAIAYFEQSLQNTLDVNTDAGMADLGMTARILLDLALELIGTRLPESLQRGESLIQQAAATLDQNPTADNEQRAYLLYVQANLALELGKLTNVLQILDNVYQLYQDNPEGLALTDDAIGRYYLQVNDPQSALNHFERALSLRLESGDECAIAKSYTYLGKLYLSIEDTSQAVSLYQNALEIALANEDRALQLQSLKGLAKSAIVEQQWQTAIALSKDAITLLQEPVDTIEIGYLYCDLSEALLGDRQINQSLLCIRAEVLPRFRDYQYQKGIAIAKHIRGRIYVQRLLEGLDSLDEDAIETAQDSLLDASMGFEELGMMLDYAKTLYDLACLYQLCSNSPFQYQYQGKALRSLELSLSVLDKLGMSSTKFGTQVDELLDQVMGGKF
jgi:tetratricopeptide (TPR) repeat protein